ncbi:diguanylate cyclase (GGDEF)-like protein [Silvimonas terrae]|uniref:Diguanylate cyclase (GGDEF)-like protein n=1 Tax=Silvimonas terrae TaxID=300266 RepID=A0A840R8Q9_9NEIS|nr:GGDEF domain-containing protein [Silvimonas terrae]MBB5189715.1 diguanylate cyclase (GGDEF)-like protein [Silvimonas terrae]
MMSGEVVHTFGFTVYFVFALMFTWASHIQRTNPGAGWWALSISSAFFARLLYFALLYTGDTRLIITAYAFFIVLEKPLMLTGIVRFLNLPITTRWFWFIAALADLWLAIAWVGEFDGFTRIAGYSLINTSLLACAAWLIFRHHKVVPGLSLRIAALACLALAAHWLTAPVFIQLYPAWATTGFAVGTMLTLVQYLSLLTAVLSLFQKRLLESEARALDMAFLDPLTGLNNQRYMTTLFDQALLLATRPHHIVAIFYIDLDNFKPVNDKAGHAVGDEVLKAMAQRLKDCTRSTDICARVGGDEFVVIGTQFTREFQVEEMARKLLEHVLLPIEVGGYTFQLGASIGVSLYPEHGNSLTELVQCADKAMYHIKRNGKSGVAVYGGETAGGLGLREA